MSICLTERWHKNAFQRKRGESLRKLKRLIIARKSNNRGHVSKGLCIRDKNHNHDIILSIVSQHSLRLPWAIVTNYILHRKTNVDTWINSTAYRTNFITEELKNTKKKPYMTSSLVVFIFTWISREYSLEAIKSVANQTSLKFNIFLSILLFCMFSENSQMIISSVSNSRK